MPRRGHGGTGGTWTRRPRRLERRRLDITELLLSFRVGVPVAAAPPHPRHPSSLLLLLDARPQQRLDAEGRHVLSPLLLLWLRGGQLISRHASIVTADAVVAAIQSDDIDHLLVHFVGVELLQSGLAPSLLMLVVSPQRVQLDVDTLGGQLLLLLLQLLQQLLLAPLAFFLGQLLGRDGLPGARLRMCIVGGPAGALLGVLLLAELGPPVLEPHLQTETRVTSIMSSLCAFSYPRMQTKRK